MLLLAKISGYVDCYKSHRSKLTTLKLQTRNNYEENIVLRYILLPPFAANLEPETSHDDLAKIRLQTATRIVSVTNQKQYALSLMQ